MASAFARQAQPHRCSRRGFSVIWLLILFMALLTMGVLGIEIGWLRINQTKAQTAAEAASLAAAGALSDGRVQALQEARAFSQEQQGPRGPIELIGTSDNAGGDLTFGQWNPETREFQPALLAPNAVQASIRLKRDHPNGPVPWLIASFLGLPDVNIETRVIAHRTPRFPVPTSAWILDPLGPDAISLKQQSKLLINGTIDIQSESSRAVVVQGGSLVRATKINVQGDYEVDSDETIRGLLDTESLPQAIPPRPPLNLTNLQERETPEDGLGTILLEPGRYPDGLVASQGSYQLARGLYLFEGPGIRLSEAASLEGEDVFIVLGEGATLFIDQANVQLATTPNVSGIENTAMIVVLAEGNSPNAIELNDTSCMLNGMLYAPGKMMRVENTQLMCKRLAIQSLSIDRDTLMTVGPAEPHPIDLLLVK